MKKAGFTLAEVLISLGIVGTIAAITLPTLMSNTTEAQIGPKLAKAVSTFEQANESLLDSLSADSLSDAGLTNDSGNYVQRLSRFLKITPSGNWDFTTKDGMLFAMTVTEPNPDSVNPAYMQRIGNVMIDINGLNRPNVLATDRFNFSWWNDGSLRPMGGTNWEGLSVDPNNPGPDSNGGNTHWTTQCAIGAIPTEESSMFCAGHIFENNLKVLYR